jgi:hypothetical protein
MKKEESLDQGKPRKSYKVNPLTLEPGGATVSFKFSDGNSESHPRIKYVIPYVKKVMVECLEEGRQLLEARIVSSDKMVFDGSRFYKL